MECELFDTKVVIYQAFAHVQNEEKLPNGISSLLGILFSCSIVSLPSRILCAHVLKASILTKSHTAAACCFFFLFTQWISSKFSSQSNQNIGLDQVDRSLSIVRSWCGRACACVYLSRCFHFKICTLYWTCRLDRTWKGCVHTVSTPHVPVCACM